jgi:NAD(P)-dependent dehydrogenase (short-subunit alcohol dehydrogenase family)
MALSLAQKGIDVVLTYHSKKDEALAVVADIEKSGQKAAALQLDAGEIKSFDAFFAQLKTTLKDNFGTAHFDFLINNAGTALYAPFADTTEEQFDTALNIHYKGVFFITQKALPIINDGGRIINISSGLARFSFPDQVPCKRIRRKAHRCKRSCTRCHRNRFWRWSYQG